MCGGTERLSIEAEAFHNFFFGDYKGEEKK